MQRLDGAGAHGPEISGGHACAKQLHRCDFLIDAVSVSGGHAAMKKGSWFVRPVMVDVRIGEPVETTGYTLDDRDDLIDIVRERIEALRRT